MITMNFKEQEIKIDLSELKMQSTNEALFKNNYQMLNLNQLNHALDSFRRQEITIKKGIENQLSKSNLIIACHNLVKSSSQLSYFPSYELMMDDLRDYRFYAEDMIHPSPQAVNYIWQKLVNWSFHEVSHRPCPWGS